MNNSNWNETDHPRDEDGKFTFKGLGTSKKESEEEKMQKRADILFPTMSNNKSNRIFITDNKQQNDSLSKKFDNTIFSDNSREKARKFIQKEEGFREEAYKDIAGIWTIGYGRTENVKPGDKISKEEAEKLFSKDFNRHKKALNEVKIPLSENEKIALTSFIYNVGAGAFKNSTLLKKLNKGDKKGAANEFDIWIYSKGKVSEGLKNRRKREKELFLTPDN